MRLATTATATARGTDAGPRSAWRWTTLAPGWPPGGWSAGTDRSPLAAGLALAAATAATATATATARAATRTLGARFDHGE
jgi:hypothetical protein